MGGILTGVFFVYGAYKCIISIHFFKFYLQIIDF